MNSEIRKAVVDLTGRRSCFDLHQRPKDSLDLPEGYGMDRDAFWDMINRDLEYDFVTVVGTFPEKQTPVCVRMRRRVLFMEYYFSLYTNVAFVLLGSSSGAIG